MLRDAASLKDPDLPTLRGVHHDHRVFIEGNHTNGTANLVTATGFDFDAIDRHLGLVGPDDPPIKGWTEKQYNVATECLGWLAEYFGQSKTLHSAGARAFVFAFVLRPQLFGVKSLSSFADQFGYTRQGFSKFASEIFRLARGRYFGPSMNSTAAQRAERARIATKNHRLAGHKLHQEEEP